MNAIVPMNPPASIPQAQRPAAGLALIALAVLLSSVDLTPARARDFDGGLPGRGGVIFPIGFYEFPSDADGLRAMARAGINLVRCGSEEQLDRAAEVGLLGWVPLPLQQGPSEALRRRIDALKDHPALALWEGPDEIVWNFTAYSGLARTAGFTRRQWWEQDPKAAAYARHEAKRIMPRMRKAVALVRALDGQGHPVWLNEAAESDVFYVRQYLDFIDVTGCDYYPVKKAQQNLRGIGQVTERWKFTGRGKPVYIVLQAFSWHQVRPSSYPEPRYPSFGESRFMAYDALVHGAHGLLYWGSTTIDQPAFRTSLYSLTAELARLQPFLVQPDQPGATVRWIEAALDGAESRGVRASIRRSGEDWLVILVNEDNHWHQAVELTGLTALNGRRLDLLYGDETVQIRRGELLTRMQAYQVKVFATSKHFETDRITGRGFGR